MNRRSVFCIECLEQRLELNGTIAAADGGTAVIHTTAALSQPRILRDAASAGTKAIFPGGFVLSPDPDMPMVFSVNVADIFNAATGLWSAHALPLGDAGHVLSAGPRTLFYGLGASSTLGVLENGTGNWSTLPVPANWQNYATASVGDKAFFAGGYFPRYPALGIRPTSLVLAYDARTGLATPTTLSQARFGITAVTVGGKVLFAGGMGVGPGGNGYSNVVDIYDSATDKWSTAKLSQRRSVTCVAVVGDLAIFAGGGGGARHYWSSVVDIYDAATGKWSAANLPQGYEYIQAATVGHTVFFTARDDIDPANGSDLIAFDSVTRLWSTSKVPNDLYPQVAATVGAKVIFGGQISGTKSYPSADADFADVYDATTGLWSTAPATPGIGGGATTVGSTAFFAGGGSTHDVVDVYTDAAPAPALCGAVTGRAGGNDAVTVTNSGDAALRGPYTVRLFASADRTINGAILLGSRTVSTPLGAGGSAVFSVSSLIPPGTPAGKYHLLAAVKDSSGHLAPIAAEDSTFRLRASRAATLGTRSRPQGIRLAHATAEHP